MLSENLETSHTIAAASQLVALEVERALTVEKGLPIEGGRLQVPWSGGRLDVGFFEDSRGVVDSLATSVSRASKRVSESPDSLLIPPVSKGRREALATLGSAKRAVDSARGAAFLIPRLFGADRQRTWILGAENNAELRGRGGYIGSFGILGADDGKLDLGEFRPVAGLKPLPFSIESAPFIPTEYRRNYVSFGGLDAWPNLTMSPDFPTAARIFSTALENYEGIASDGVVSIDPVGLSYLLEVTGPIDVEGIPERIDSANIVDWSLSRAYAAFDDQEQRREQLSRIAQAVWIKLIGSEDIDSAKLASAFGKALSQRRLVVYSSVPAEQRVIESLDIGGGVEQGPGDYLMVVAQNFGENKLDYFLKRSSDYSGKLQWDGSIKSSLDVTVTNTVVASDLPPEVGGERSHLSLAEGTTRQLLTVFIPRKAVITEVKADGRPTNDFSNDFELGRRRLGMFVELAPGASRKVRFEYTIPRVQNGTYRLVLQNQATVEPEQVSVAIELPSGKFLRWTGTPGASTELEADLRTPVWLSAARALRNSSHPGLIVALALIGLGAIILGVVLRARLDRSG